MVDIIKQALFKGEREALARKEREFDERVAQRVGEIVAKIDPFEKLMEDFHGIFSETHEHVEDPLDEASKLQIEQWCHVAAHSRAFKHLTDWIMNTQANETLKKGAVTTDRLLYGRAQISCMLLFVKEVNRLSVAYEERIKPEPGFDSAEPVE